MKIIFGIITFCFFFNSISSKSLYNDEIINPLIVNGTDAEIAEFPFIVSLRTTTSSHSCGGSILNEYWILTVSIIFIIIHL